MKDKVLLVSEFQNKKIYSNELKMLLSIKYDVDIYDTLKNTKIKGIFFKIFDKLLLFLLKKFKFNLFYYFFGRLNIKKSILKKIENNDYKFIIFTKSSILNPVIFKYITTKVYYFFFDTIDEINKFNLIDHFRFSENSYVISRIMSKKLNKKYDLKTKYCPQFFNSSSWYPLTNVKKDIDVLFVGSKLKERENYINFLEINNVNIFKFGIGWNNQPIFGKDLLELFSRSKIILNFTRDRDSFSVRVYHIMASKGFMLSTYSNELRKSFIRGRHFDDFQNKEDCLYKIKYYLKNPNLIEKISSQAFIYNLKNYDGKVIINDYFN